MEKKKSTYIIAEAGINHNGSLDMARKLVDLAAMAGADAVKFQTFKTEECISRFAAKAEYQLKSTGASESQFEMAKKLEFNEMDHHLIFEHCIKAGIQFLSSPFDLESVNLLINTFDLPLIKIASGEITNAPLLLKVAQSNKPLILSTGMSTLGEIEQALGVLAFGYKYPNDSPSHKGFRDAYCSCEGQNVLKEKVKLLHCTTEYPAPIEDVNIRALDTLKAAFGLPVGFSDHTYGIEMPIAAVARGAVIIEKHFTLNRSLPGPDHRASLGPNQLKKMIKCIREVEAALGDGLKIPAKSEVKNINIARKSLVARGVIENGEIFTEKNLAVKRPGDGVSPMQYWEYIGRPSEKKYLKDEKIS